MQWIAMGYKISSCMRSWLNLFIIVNPGQRQKLTPCAIVLNLNIIFVSFYSGTRRPDPYHLAELALSIPQVCCLPLRSNFRLRTIIFPLLASLFAASIPKIHISANITPLRLKQYQQFIQVVIHDQVSFDGGPSIG
jgi:hypothetical protein